jgi:deoxyribodipyrimidine photo-lyase
MSPENARHAFQRDMDALQWSDDAGHLDAWKAGMTGYPVVDAGMRQLATIGWMHNRARLITASFLTKDLHLDWRLGEAHFMRLLLCGDEAQNNGNWQWITSIGVDPAPYYRRLYNPVLQQRRHDPDGAYVRRWVPELRDVPLERLAEPWRMTGDEQAAAGCVIGREYPAPIVDHAEERRRAIEAYRAVREG